MPVSKKRKFTRKNAKQYTMVSFSTDIYDGEFTLPDQKHMTVDLAASLNKGRVEKLLSWLEDAGVDAETIEAIADLEQGEVIDFIRDWGNGSVVDLPKSSD